MRRLKCSMKKLTHCLFNLGVLSFIARIFLIDSPIRLLLIPYLFFMGAINDWLDFKLFVKSEHRNFKTHSFTSPVAIGVFVIPFVLIAPFNILIALIFGVFGILSYYNHLFLDLFNPTGVYLTKNRMIAGKIRYDNVSFNLFLQIVGIILLLIAVFA